MDPGEKMQKKRKFFLIIGVSLTYIFGLIGFFQSYSTSFFNCLYATTSLFTMSLLASPEQMNIYIEIARWLAIIISANMIIIFFQSVFTQFQAHKRLKNDQLIVLHGNSDYLVQLDINIENSIIMNHSVLWGAKRHLLSFKNDNEMLNYMAEHQKDMRQDCTCYLLTDSLRRGNYERQNIVLCNLAENNARFYWKNYPLGFDENCIVIVGFGVYGRELLNEAILFNVLDVHSHIQYHIFGDGEDYLARHYELKQCLSIGQEDPQQDSLLFYTESWLKYPDLLEKADRVIIIDDDDEMNLSTLNEMNKYFVTKRVDIKYMNPQIIHSLWNENIFVFGDEKTLLSEEVVINEGTLKEAKKIHAKYYRQYVCQHKCQKDCLSCASFCKDWASLSSFIRYSNIAQADHVLNKKRILNHLKHDDHLSLYEFYQSLDSASLFLLEEIEHIRWCRYHYLHNWCFGKVRDKVKKEHPCLVDYSLLLEEDKRKDQDAWKSIFDREEF